MYARIALLLPAALEFQIELGQLGYQQLMRANSSL